MKKIILFIFILLITSNTFSAPSGGVYAWDETNNIWRVVKATIDGVLIASSSTATAAAPNYNTMQSPAGAMAGWYSAGEQWVPIKCDSDGNIMISGGGSGTSVFTGLTDTPSDYAGQSGKVVSVKSDESGLEFISGGGGTGDVASVNGQTGEVVLDSDDISEGSTNLYNVQADWNESVTSEPDYINNKPDIEELRQNLSAGLIDTPSYTDNGDGTVTIGTANCRLFSDSNFNSTINKYSVSGNTFILTNNNTNYIIISYNSGSPVMSNTLDVTDINESTVIPVYTLIRQGTEICRISWNSMGNGLSNKLHYKDVKLNRFEKEPGTGLTLDETGTRNVTVTSGYVWNGTKRNSLTNVDTSLASNDICFFYHSAGSWTYSTITQYNNTQYDNGTGLQTLTTNRYTVNWVYRNVDESKNRLCIVLGGGDYTLSQAESSNVPEIPDSIRNGCILVGRIIVQKNDSTAYSIENVSDISLAYTQVSDHNNLNGLQGGTTNEYYHLTSAEKSNMITISSPVQGDIIYYNGTSWVVLNKGTASQVLSMNAGATAPEWVTASSGSSSIDEEIEFPAGSFDYPDSSSLAIAPLDYIDGTNRRIYFHSFDDSTNEYLKFNHTLKSGYDSSSGIKIEFHGFSNTQTSGDVVLTVKHGKYDNSSSWDAAWNTNIDSIYSSVPSTAKYRDVVSVTLNNISSYSAGDTIHFLVYRNVGNPDDLTGNWNLTNLYIKYTRDL